MLLVITTISTTWIVVKRNEALAAENQRLRLFNARELRRYKRPAPVPRGTENAQHILGTPAEIIGAVWRQENGPPDIETGVLGKTAYFSRNSPIEDWAALETGRTLNIYAWKWMTTTPEGKKALKQVLEYASGPYIDKEKMGEKEAKTWAKNVLEFSRVK